MLRVPGPFVVLATIVWACAAVALSPADKCEADKLKRAGKYSFCRMKAESKAIKTNSAPDYSLCNMKLGDKWTNAETIGGGQCPTNGDLASMQTRMTNDADAVTACLNGTCPPSCGDGTVNGAESCDGADLGGESCESLGFAGTLACTAGCGFDVSACVPSCGDNVKNGSDACDGADLGGATCLSIGYTLGGALACTAGCGFDVSDCQGQVSFPATGQTTSYGTSSDGNLQAGAALAYTDNGDGTITDNNTGLMWEKKSGGDGGNIHDVGNSYTWGMTSPPYTMNGTIVTIFLDTLNDVSGGGVSCFAGHCDWRIPNVKELQSLINYENSFPSVSPAFNTACAPACTVLTCSCTASAFHWSSTTYPSGDTAWLVDFDYGSVGGTAKDIVGKARAVRGGS